ncbi:MAG: hypothetical protein GXO93_06755, partial [FCB group bacterium]|nr:hypothetical protein [FCB group bacterium]
MNNKSKFLFFFIFLFIVSSAFAGNYVNLVKKGNKAYRTKDYKKALDYYHKAETDLPESPELDYNMAGVMYHQKGYEKAVDQYTKALNTKDINLE